MLSHNISFGQLIKWLLIFANSVQSVRRISRAFATNAIINTLSAWFLVQLLAALAAPAFVCSSSSYAIGMLARCIYFMDLRYHCCWPQLASQAEG